MLCITIIIVVVIISQELVFLKITVSPMWNHWNLRGNPLWT